MTFPQPKTILLVDDDEDCHVIYGTHLRHLGHEVLSAHDGVEALRLARGSRPHVVVVDVRLPQLGGLEVVRTLKASPASAAIPVLVLTAYGEKNLFESAEESGADAFLTKPCTPEDLEAALAPLLRGRRPPGGIERRLRKRR
jgi:CheY-like chemotaxis protein